MKIKIERKTNPDKDIKRQANPDKGIKRPTNPDKDIKIRNEMFSQKKLSSQSPWSMTIEDTKEKIKNLLNRKRNRLLLEVENEANFKKKRLLLEAENEANLKRKKINEDIALEERLELAKLTEMFEKELVYRSFLEKILVS